MVWTEEYNATYDGGRKTRPLQGRMWGHHMIHDLAMLLNRGDAPVVIIVGKTNTGKSTTALRLVELFYDELDMFKGSFTDDQLVYDPLPFMKKVRDIPVPDKEDRINPDREILIFDEAEDTFNINEYHSDANKAVDKVINLMRIKNCMYIFCAPHLSDVDPRIRKNADWVVHKETQQKAQPVIIMKNHMADKQDEASNGYYIDGKWYPSKPAEEYDRDYSQKDYDHKQKRMEEIVEEQIEKEKEEEEKKKKENASLDL